MCLTPSVRQILVLGLYQTILHYTALHTILWGEPGHDGADGQDRVSSWLPSPNAFPNAPPHGRNVEISISVQARKLYRRDAVVHHRSRGHIPTNQRRAAGLPTRHLPAADQGGLTVKRFQERQHVMVSWGKASRVSAAQSSKSRQLPPTLPSPSLEKVEAAEALVTFYGASVRSVCAPLPRFLYAYARSGSLGPAALLNALARRLTTINHSS